MTDRISRLNDQRADEHNKSNVQQKFETGVSTDGTVVYEDGDDHIVVRGAATMANLRQQSESDKSVVPQQGRPTNPIIPTSTNSE